MKNLLETMTADTEKNLAGYIHGKLVTKEFVDSAEMKEFLNRKRIKIAWRAVINLLKEQGCELKLTKHRPYRVWIKRD